MTKPTRLMAAVNRVLAAAAGGVLVFMLVIVVLNMAGRPFGHPIQGAFDVMGYGTGLLVALALGSSQERGVHISVDILFTRFPAGVKRWVGCAADLAGAAFFGATAVKLAGLGVDRMRAGEALQNIPELVEYPFVFLVAVGFAALALTLLLAGVRLVAGEEGAS